MVVVPNFNMSATVGFIDPFRAANDRNGMVHFQWEFVSDTGGNCIASNGTSMETIALVDASDKADIFIVSASWEPERYGTPRLSTALRNAARGGATPGALDTGAFILAQAGMLNGRRATDKAGHTHISAHIRDRSGQMARPRGAWR